MKDQRDFGYFVAPSKYERNGLVRRLAEEAILEGQALRERLSVSRVLEPLYGASTSEERAA